MLLNALTAYSCITQAHKQAKIRVERDLLKTMKDDGTIVKASRQKIEIPEAILEVAYSKGQDRFPEKALQVSKSFRFVY